MVGTVSTGVKVYEIRVTGQIFSDDWMSVGIRFKEPDITNEDIPISKMGGLEMYVNQDLVGRMLLPVINQKDGTTTFKSLSSKIDGRDPPVVMIGCHWNYDDKKFDYHSGGAYDELAMWTRQLVKNATMNELPFMYGGYSSNFADVSADAFNAMLGGVDLSSDGQAGLAHDVLEAMLLGPPTTTPAIPTRTPDPSMTGSTTEELAVTTTVTTTTVNTAPPDTLARSQLSTQAALSSMLTVEGNCAARTPEEADKRLALAKVAAKLLDGDAANVAAWEAVESKYSYEEGAPKTLREMEEYMLYYVGCVNISMPFSSSPYYSNKTRSMHFATYGRDFGKLSLAIP